MTTLKNRGVVPHGVVFIYDPSAIIDAPEDTGLGPVLNTKNCISIWTIDEDQGDALLVLTESEEEISGHLVFDEFIETPGHKIGFNDSGVNIISEMNVRDDRTRLSIYTNDQMYPDKIVCLIH